MPAHQTTAAVTVTMIDGGGCRSRDRRGRDWKCAALCASELFTSAAERELDLLARSAVTQRFRRGHIVQLAGDAAIGLYVVVIGALRLLRQSAIGREQVLSIEHAGSVVGLAAVFDGGPYIASIIAEEDPTELLFVHKHDVHRICTSSPPLLARVLQILAARVRCYAELVDALALHDVDRRVAWFLLQQARDCGVISEAGLTFTLAVTHRQIASRIGSVRERVTRAFARLHNDGLIVPCGRTVVVPDTGALARFASR